MVEVDAQHKEFIVCIEAAYAFSFVYIFDFPLKVGDDSPQRFYLCFYLHSRQLVLHTFDGFGAFDRQCPAYVIHCGNGRIGVLEIQAEEIHAFVFAVGCFA